MVKPVEHAAPSALHCSPPRKFARLLLPVFLGLWTYLSGCNLANAGWGSASTVTTKTPGRASVTTAVESLGMTLKDSETTAALPFYSGSPDEMCRDQRFFNKSGEVVRGTMDCGSIDEIVTCAEDGQVSCLTSRQYPSLDVKRVVSAKMLTTLVAGGVAGKLKLCSRAGEIGCVATPHFSAFAASHLHEPFSKSAGMNQLTTCTREGQENCILSASFRMVPTTLSCGPVCSVDGEQECVVNSPLKAIAASTISAWDLRSGHSLAGVAGALKTNCRNGVNPSVFNHDGSVATISNRVTKSGISSDPWDTVDGAPASAHAKVEAWSSDTFCDDSNFLDVTTKDGGRSRNACGSNAVCIYQDRISNIQVTGILASDANST